MDYIAALSPKLMEAYKSKTAYPQHNPEKAAIWSIGRFEKHTKTKDQKTSNLLIIPFISSEKTQLSIGITLLSMICNEKYEQYYNWLDVKISYDVIENRLSRVRDLGYSSHLVNLLEVMLCPTEVNRPDLERTVKYLKEVRNESFDISGIQNQYPPSRGGFGRKSGYGGESFTYGDEMRQSQQLNFRASQSMKKSGMRHSNAWASPNQQRGGGGRGRFNPLMQSIDKSGGTPGGFY